MKLKTTYILCFFCLFSVCSQNIFSKTLNDNEIEKLLKQMEREGNKQLPYGSPSSMVISIQAGPGRLFTYRSVQTTPSTEWTSVMKQHSKRIAVNDYCTNPQLSEFKSQRVTVSWIISDTDGRHVTTNTVSPSMCH